MRTAHEARAESDLKRFILMFYADLAHEIVEGWGDKLEALCRLAGYQNHTTFLQLCRRELGEARGPGLFIETMIRERPMLRCNDTA